MILVGLEHVPAGMSAYTAYLKFEDGEWVEEIDFLAPRNASVRELVEQVETHSADLYDADWTVLGITDQSSGTVVLDNRDREKERND